MRLEATEDREGVDRMVIVEGWRLVRARGLVQPSLLAKTNAWERVRINLALAHSVGGVSRTWTPVSR